ncbi:hypothetical protein [Nocardia aurantiaca]|uniref:Mce-associated membrane protein n=1 Tax=Nocardia aurantiaca TaxID=2675850 RepID=A0A6I3L4Q9_9NOCA|nr:hypothetical protein [Nocardia aurantiaca]MTE15930.1 hypothetical protein [Nocardia aurantiaca]
MSQNTEPTPPVDPDPAPARGKTVQLKVSTLVTAVAAVLLVGALVTVTVLWQSARGDLSDRDGQAANDKRAEQVASNYAMGAADLDYSDFNAWTARLKSNTTAALASKFDATSSKLQEILVPLKWTSSPTLLSSQVITRDNGVYKVNVYLNVNSTNAQNPDGVLTTIYYTVNVDPKSDWKVTDVGGIDLPLPKR